MSNRIVKSPSGGNVILEASGNSTTFNNNGVLNSPTIQLTPQSVDPVSPEVGFLQYADGTARTEGLWEYKSTGWSMAMGVQGATGISGQQGTTGILGINGVTGIQGIQGVTGIIGSTGIQGIQGTTGILGINGVTGIQGIQGLTGIIGSTGIQGIQGTTGVLGINGVTGIQGIQGVTGIIGIQGIQGTTGIIGSTGIQGIQGTTGIQGSNGSAGAQGSTGIQGIQGSNGSAGSQGSTGVQGNGFSAWASSTTYATGNLIYYTDNNFYRCTTANSDSTFTSSHWQIMSVATVVTTQITTATTGSWSTGVTGNPVFSARYWDSTNSVYDIYNVDSLYITVNAGGGTVTYDTTSVTFIVPGNDYIELKATYQ